MIGTLTLERLQVINQPKVRREQAKGFEIGQDPILINLLNELSPQSSWGDRQAAAKKLGQMRDPAAVPELLSALRTDDFWMVRCAIIQALELIKDPLAVPVLEEVALVDGFQVVRSYARKAVERLTA